MAKSLSPNNAAIPKEPRDVVNPSLLSGVGHPSAAPQREQEMMQENNSHRTINFCSPHLLPHNNLIYHLFSF